MDASVLKAMQAWPDVPDVFGWLRLDGRGSWHLRNGRITNPALIQFIGRNYVRLNNGGYAFQNGPQRVHVELESTPFVVRLRGGNDFGLEDQIGRPWNVVSQVWISQQGDMILERSDGETNEVGRMHDHDLMALVSHFRGAGQPLTDEQLTEALGDPETTKLQLNIGEHTVPCRKLMTDDLAQQFGFVALPRPPSG